MQNTYQDLITDIQSKNPEISGKLEGGKKFKLVTNFKPAGDQPEAIKKLVNNANKGEFNQVLLGVTGSAWCHRRNLLFVERGLGFINSCEIIVGEQFGLSDHRS